jgi:hypothetical protein
MVYRMLGSAKFKVVIFVYNKSSSGGREAWRL